MTRPAPGIHRALALQILAKLDNPRIMYYLISIFSIFNKAEVRHFDFGRPKMCFVIGYGCFGNPIFYFHQTLIEIHVSLSAAEVAYARKDGLV